MRRQRDAPTSRRDGRGAAVRRRRAAQRRRPGAPAARRAPTSPPALAALAARYAGRGVELASVAGAGASRPPPDLAFLMTEERAEPRRLSRAAQETLAIIAYHQPVTRAEIEAVRGVQASRGTLDVLLELGLVRMRGRRRTPGPAGHLRHHRRLPGALSAWPASPTCRARPEMKAAGLLDLDLPPDFAVPDPSRARRRRRGAAGRRARRPSSTRTTSGEAEP